jgi:hypothetical protein
VRLLPVVERELRVASRRGGTYWSRVGIVAGGFLLSAYILLGPLAEFNPAQAGRSLFLTLAWVMFATAMFTGIRATADCLSTERREGTLGLLFLTNLKGYDVVLGKLAARSLGAFYGLLGLCPILAIPIIIGGVGASDFWLAAAFLLNALLFSLSAGVFASSVCIDDRRAAGLTFIVILLATVAFPLIGLVLNWHENRPGPMTAVFLLSPGAVMVILSQMLMVPTGMVMLFAGWSRALEGYWVGMAYTAACTVMLLSAASFIVPRNWRDRSAASSPHSFRSAWRQVIYGRTSARAAFRVRSLSLNPVHWLCSRRLRKPIGVWFFLAVCLVLWVWAYRQWPREMFETGFTVFALVLVHSAFKFWVAGEAVQFFAQMRKTGGLELVLSTPLKEREVLKGQWLAMNRQFRGPLLALLAIDVLVLLFGSVPWGTDPAVLRRYQITGFCWMVVFVLDVVAIIFVGMWMGLVKKSANAAAGATASRVLVSPWIYLLVLLFLASRLNLHSGTMTTVVLATFFFVGLDVAFIYSSWVSLTQRMRQIASMPGEAAASFWTALGRWYGRWRHA